MTIEGAFSQLIVETNSNPKFDMHFQLDFSLHDFFDNLFRGGLTTTELIDGFNHLPIRGMFVAKGLGTRIIDVMLLGNPIQTVNDRVAAFQTFL